MKVSVVLASYNGSAYIGEQLESILGGTQRPDELVVVDDASTDGTVSIIQKILSNYPTVQLVLLRNTQNLGATKSFVKAALHSTGDILFFADQDDRWMPEKITTISAHFRSEAGLLMAYHDGTITDAELQPTDRSIFSTRHGGQLAMGSQRAALDIARNPDIKGCTMALDGTFARALFRNSVNGFDRYWGHDHWAALFAFGGGRVTALEEHLILHRFHGNNTSSAVKFSPWRMGSLKRYLQAMRQQDPDHFVQRYRVALEQAGRAEVPVSTALRDALQRYLDLAKRRHALHSTGSFARFKAAWAMQREGIYRRYFNGWATLLRDLLG